MIGSEENDQAALQFLDQSCHGYSQCSLNDRVLTSKNANSYLFGKHHLSDNLTFSATFLKWDVGGGVGIVDEKLKFSNYIANELNVVTYRSDGTCRTGAETKLNVGKGYGIHQKVTLMVDRQNGKVTWSVNGEIRNTAYYDQIKNKQIQWVPYIRLCSPGDKLYLGFN